MCTDVTWFHAHRCFPLRWVNLGRPRNFPSKISLSSINLIKKIFSWTNRNRPFLFHSLMTNSSIVVINVVSKPCLCPPGCIEAFFVVLDFIHCHSRMKRPRSCEQQNVLPVEPLTSVQDKISAHSARELFGLFPFPKICFH